MALGAFLAGALVAESGEGKAIEHLVEPVRDVFAAIFFVSVGMLIDPGAGRASTGWRCWCSPAWWSCGKVVGVTAGRVPRRQRRSRTSVQAGMSLAQIGEFSFIIAGVGLSLGATGDFLYPVAVAVSALTTLLTPWLIRASGRRASYVDAACRTRCRPSPRSTAPGCRSCARRPQHRTAWSRIRRLVGLLLLDVAAIAAHRDRRAR